jgi:hypothetical protein
MDCIVYTDKQLVTKPGNEIEIFENVMISIREVLKITRQTKFIG